MIPVVEKKGSHYEMGLQEGRQVSELMHEHPFLLPLIVNYFDRPGAISREEAVKRANRYVGIIEKDYPEYIEEIRGIAEGAGCEYELALLMNLHRFIFDGQIYTMHERAQAGCSGFVAAGDATSDGETIAAQNVDNLLYVFGCGIIARGHPKGANSWIMFTYGGRSPLLGFTAMNDKGLACTAMGGPRDKEDVGFPADLFERVALEHCSTIDEVIDRAMEIPRWSVGKGNYVFVDSKGYMARLSITARYPSITLTKNYFMAGTNSYHNFEWDGFNPLYEGKRRSETYSGACPRYERLVELLDENKGKIDVETARAIFSDHKYGNTDLSICRHVPYTPAVSDPTNYNVIVKPSVKKMWACERQPCKTQLKDYQVVELK